MSYFDDQYEAWMENDCKGDPTEYEGDEVAQLLVEKELRRRESEKEKTK